MTNYSSTSGAQTTPPDNSARRLERSTTDKVVAGVAGGLGQYFGLDAVIFRIAFVVLAVAGGGGFLLYALAWLLLPRQGEQRSRLQSAVGGGDKPKKTLAIVLLVVGGLTLLGELNSVHQRVLVPTVLIGAGVAVLLAHNRGPDDRSTPSGPSGPSGPSAPLGNPPTEPHALAAAAGAGAKTEPTLLGGMEPRSSNRSVTAVVVSLILVGGGLGGLAGVPVTILLAGGLSSVGVGLLVGSRRGRARGLVPVGLILALALGVAGTVSFLGRSFGNTTVDNRVERPTSLAELRRSYQQGAGELTIDLSRLDLSAVGSDAAPIEIDASLGLGDLKVVVPAGAATNVRGKVTVGDLSLLGQHSDGINVSRRVIRPAGPDDDGPDLNLDLKVGLGDIEVRRAPA